MKDLAIFSFQNQSVRIQTINGDPWFCNKDVCDILEIKNNRQALKRVEAEDVIMNDTHTSSGTQKMSFVNEAGLYALIFQSKTTESRAFKKWVFNEVLPQIRKVGKFEIQPQLPQNYVEALKCLVIAEEEKLALENTVKEKEDTIARQQITIENAKELFKEIADKTGCVKFKVCASLLNIKESELKAILRQNKWIYLKKLFPTTDGRSNGYVKLQAETFDVRLKSGSKVQKSSPAFYITEKGYCKILEQVSGILVN